MNLFGNIIGFMGIGCLLILLAIGPIIALLFYTEQQEWEMKKAVQITVIPYVLYIFIGFFIAAATEEVEPERPVNIERLN